MAGHAGVPCTGVSDGSLASALGYKSLAAPTSSTQPEQSGSISGTSTVCTYGAMTSAAAVKNDVTVVYEAFTKSVPNTQAVALFKSGQGGHGVDYRRVHGGMARSQGMQRGTGEGGAHQQPAGCSQAHYQ